jgi:uncharacterized damage-inducible protein DinB
MQLQHEQADMLVAKQYDLVKNAREVVLDFVSTLLHADYLGEVPAFPRKSMRDLQVHTANVYIHWIGRFAMENTQPYLEEKKIGSAAAMRKQFEQVDRLVDRFIQQYSEQWQDPFTKPVPGEEQSLTTTPLAVFTHVITHEFHHKGQLMTMARLLGYTPPDTDVIRL